MIQYLIDAFADRPFTGNPACVVAPFDAWPSDAFMQNLAMENNQAETAFLLRTDDPQRFGLRWFTPTMEVPLCGHATLASAHALFREWGVAAHELCFDTLSGELRVRQANDRLEMDFPAYTPVEIPAMAAVVEALSVEPIALYGGPALIALLDCEATVRQIVPDLSRLPAYQGTAYTDRHLVVTAQADANRPYDVVSRLFAPDMGIPEDPATGSMHCMLAPLYQSLTGRAVMTYYQAHPRRGAYMQCEVTGDRVKLRGQAVTVARTELNL
ncbi:PhzF family phenazine biosynthesis protein [Asticcacaulis sp. 201]|uniref:PhzF family phenazine biosynthesis protein n=1 Tax=Asticcacaulis sp. 201 TaxID=3028787 RepID=UPI0029169B1A|nr:PhzF family phenazine biosynthesis protein [Asticcacaulis sp. 201]MDV6333111.1 PhzF family phenazine biosynthesis protein [Asticcacaulis sp. 201]